MSAPFPQKVLVCVCVCVTSADVSEECSLCTVRVLCNDVIMCMQYNVINVLLMYVYTYVVNVLLLIAYISNYYVNGKSD